MIFNWRDYLTIAQDLCAQDTEAHFRIAISRGYYAIFNIMRLKAGYHNKKETSHQDFIKELVNPTDKLVVRLNIDEDDIIVIGNTLNFLRQERNLADYDGLERFSKNRAVSALEMITETLKIFE